jgi:hypothetical protein
MRGYASRHRRSLTVFRISAAKLSGICPGDSRARYNEDTIELGTILFVSEHSALSRVQSGFSFPKNDFQKHTSESL